MLKLIGKINTNESQLIIDIPNELKQAAKVFTSKLAEKHNGYCELTIDTPKKPRSTGERSQNHHLNGHIADIARQAGCTHECAKYAVKVWACANMDYPCEVFAGIVHPKPERLTNTEECAILIEAAHAFALEYGYTLKEV